MGFYAYLGHAELGSEQLGTSGRMIIEDLKTRQGAIRRCKKYWAGKEFRIYSYTNFYDKRTFKRVY